MADMENLRNALNVETDTARRATCFADALTVGDTGAALSNMRVMKPRPKTRR
jgi:hypothetical protein